MVVRKLNETIKEMYHSGLEDENFVMEAVQHTLGGECENLQGRKICMTILIFGGIVQKKGRIGIDVKGIKKKNRKDTDVDDTINWIEILNVRGNPGWIYGKSEYIAFRTKTKILFVKTTDLQNFATEKTKGKELVHSNPKGFYIPYQRYGRMDMVFKCPTSDLEKLADFSIEC